MKRSLLSMLILAAFLVPAAFAEADTIPSRITDVEVRGNSSVPAEDILSAAFSKVGEGIEEDKIRNDLRAIYALGPFEDVAVSFEAFRDGTRIVYRVVENPKISAINVSGNTVYSYESVIETMGIASGEVFNFRVLRSGIDALNRRYKQDGYTMARVVDVATDQGVIDLKLVEGMVESVSIEGNDVTLDHVILREMDTKPGSVFNEEVLSKDLRRVFNLGFFSEIVPAFEPGTAADRMVLKLKMKETRTNTVNFGGGYGEREGWFGFVDLSINNLMGTGQGMLIRGQSGQQLTTYQFRYTNPWFIPDRLGPKTSYTLRLWNTQGRDVYITQQDEWNVGWEMALGKTYKDVVGSSILIGSESVWPRGTATFESYTAPYIGLNLSLDTRDFWMNPTKGIYHVLSVKQGWKYTSGVTNFFKVGLDLNAYNPVADKQVLAGRLSVGLGMGDVPMGELYYAGGPNTVRGYALSEIRRGTRKMISNVEYRYNFNEMFQGVFFFDWGNAWDGSDLNTENFITGWGPGIRFNTPLGPIRLDFGVGSGRTFADGILHFSIGQAF